MKQYLDENIQETHNTTYILVSSLPRIYPEFLLSKILCEIGHQGKSQISIGDNCCAILNALEILNSIGNENGSACLICCDSFSKYISETAIKDKPGMADWKDCISALAFNEFGNYGMQIQSRYSIHDNSLHDMFVFDPDLKMTVNQYRTKKFAACDLVNEKIVIDNLLKLDGTELMDYDAFVFVNREQPRTEAIIHNVGIPIKKVYSSRGIIGHTGGSDILFNLKLALSASGSQQLKVLISANGLGYCWQGLTLTISKK